MKKRYKLTSQQKERIFSIINDFKMKNGTHSLRVIVINHKPIPDVDIFLTEKEFIDNAIQELKDTGITITEEIFQALDYCGFKPRAGFLSRDVKLVPYPITIEEGIHGFDDNLIDIILDRKKIIYNAQKKGLLSCDDDLSKIGVIDVYKSYSTDVQLYKGWEPIYLFSQVREFIKMFSSVVVNAIKGAVGYKNKLKKFEDLINSSEVKEESLQNYLEDNTWIFGTEYIDVKPKKSLSHEYIMDFLLRRFDNSWEVVELELPTDGIFTKKLNVTAKVTKSIGQIQNAQGFILKSYEFLKARENINVFKPRGVLFIGNILSYAEKDRLEIINKSFGDITIFTYQDLLLKARKQVELFEKLYKD